MMGRFDVDDGRRIFAADAASRVRCTFDGNVMKKIKMSLVVLAALGVLYTGAAWVVGMRAESMLARVVAQNNQRLAQMFGESPDAPRAAMTEYQRGVFSSQLRYTIHLNRAGLRDMGDTPQDVQFHVALQHGPLPWDLLRSGDLAPQLIYGQLRLLPTPLTQPWIDVAGEDALRAQARVGFAQNGSGNVTLAPIALKKDDGELRFSGGQVNVTFTDHFANSVSTGGFASLEIVEDGETRMQIRDITVTGQFHRDGDVEQSDSHLGMSSIYLDLDEIVGEVQLENFGIDFAAEQVGALLDYRFQYSLGSTKVDGVNLGAFDLGVSAKQIDLPALMGLAKVLEGIEQGAALDFDALHKHARVLLNAQPTIAIDPLRWRTEKGESRAALTVDLFAPDADQDVTFEDLGLQYVREANLAVDVSRAMALHVAGLLASGHDGGGVPPQMLPMLFDQYADRLQSAGLVRIDGDQVRLQARYHGEDETVELNGARMSLAEFAVLVMRTL